MTDTHTSTGLAGDPIGELTGDLAAIGSELGRATRRDQQRRTRRRRVMRTGAIVAFGTVGLSGTAFGAAALTGVVDLRPVVHTAPAPAPVPGALISTTTAATAVPASGYRYGIDGQLVDSDTSPQLFVVSDHPLSAARIAQLRDACAQRGGVPRTPQAAGGDSVWVRESSCAAAQP